MATTTETRDPLRNYLRVQVAADRDVLKALGLSLAKIDSELRRLESSTRTGDAVRADQLRLAKAEIHGEMGRLWMNVGAIVKAREAEAIAAGVKSSWNGDALRKIMKKEEEAALLLSAQATAENGVRAVQARLGMSRLPLSERVYRAGALSSGQVDRVINDALARGASAKELADDVRRFVDPSTPGGLRYASTRLARTELNNAFHAAQITTAEADPWTLAVRWHLSGSHPKPDDCNRYAETVHVKGLGPGVFKPDAVPAKPHPNCLCFTTSIGYEDTPAGDEAFYRAFESGEFDERLDELGFTKTEKPDPSGTAYDRPSVSGIGPRLA